ncbi:PEGA domain-containing protein, partial [Candidatus Saccharibacteria bacterium]|nr:PEGA domain-containing protein [Candidatus Saccharibacteria bacterium]
TTVVDWTLGPSDSFSSGEIVWLSPSSTGTEILVISKPAAEIFLEEESLGSSPLSKEVQPGEYNVEIRKEGYLPWSLRVAVKEGYRLNISANLSLNPFATSGGEISAGGKDIKITDFSTTEPLLLADYTLWVRGAVFWAERDEEKSYNYFLTAEGKLYSSDGSEVSLDSLSKQTEAITVAYLG